MEEFPEWEKPMVARPGYYAALWADDLGVSRDSPAWEAQYAVNLRGLRDRAAARAAGLFGLPARAGETVQVAAMGVRKPGIEWVHYDCGNGFWVILSRGVISYGREDGLWEAALAVAGRSDIPGKPPPGTARNLLGWSDDVIGRLSPEDARILLGEVAALSPLAAGELRDAGKEGGGGVRGCEL